jgi:hypothetical protein
MVSDPVPSAAAAGTPIADSNSTAPQAAAIRLIPFICRLLLEPLL